jgi:diaminopimelate epimerase
MHGAGNDFLLVDSRSERRDWSALARAMCERNTGAGADGLLVVQDSSRAATRMVVYNPDGSEPEMCGNGLRCFAKWVVEEGMAQPDGDDLTIETAAGVLTATLVRERGVVVGATVDMGPPYFEPTLIPVAVEQPAPVLDLPVAVNGSSFKVNCVSMGNPHAVHFLPTPVGDFPLREVGPRMEHHDLFPARVNFEVARVLDRGHIESRTWERGVGETQACGTGACAIMVSAHLHGLVDDEVEVKEPGGVLTLRWNGAGNVILTGPAAFVYSGDWPD